MDKATFEEIYHKPYELDATDIGILATLTEKWNRQEGPRVGDYVITPVGTLRFTYDWGDGIQTTTAKFGGGSFYLAPGCMSYSGALDSAIPKTSLEPTDEVRNGPCWFFSHGWMRANNGVNVTVPCRVYRLMEGK